MLMSKGWKFSSPYDKIKPIYSDNGNSLLFTAIKDGYCFGKTVCDAIVIEGDNVYTINVKCSVQGLNGDIHCVATWSRDDETMLISRNYLIRQSDDTMYLEMYVPKDAVKLTIEYFMWSYGGGEVEFFMPQIVNKGAYKPRYAVLGTAWMNAPCERTIKDNVNDIISVIEKAGNSEEKPDILCFSENSLSRYVTGEKKDKSVSLNGEEIIAIRSKAKEFSMYIVLGVLLEIDGYFKNTGILIGRDGEIVGKYIKTHLTISEYEDGLVPGDDIPIFDLDFGRVGILICWDHWFPETARMLYIKGADVICLLTAGNTEYQQTTRAVDNEAYLIVAGRKEGVHSKIIHPLGEHIADIASLETDYIARKVDLNERHYQYWLSVEACNGEGRDIYLNERRPDLYRQLAMPHHKVRETKEFK